MTSAAVMGGGSWGTAYAKVLADAGTSVTLWTRRPVLAEAINATRENPDYLPGVRLPDGVKATSDAAAALSGSDVVVLAVPSQQLRENLTGWALLLPPGCLLVNLAKGVELQTSKRMSEVICDVTGVPTDRVAVVSGPNLAKEIAAEHPAATVVACTDKTAAARLQQVSGTAYFRPYTNTDVVGCELGGAVKNVIALAVGIAAGMDLGDNTKASIITRGLAETARLGVKLGAEPLTFAGLAGLGDLVATCMSPLSRNRAVGEELGRGRPLEDIVAGTRQVAEGVKSCASIRDLAHSCKVEMPIVEHVYLAVHEGLPPTEAVRSLMSRDMKAE
jgi:glycerol-3-phosphate dehydrogenase (NAD(P)+)